MGDLINNLPLDPIPMDDSHELKKIQGIFIDQNQKDIRSELKIMAIGSISFLIAVMSKPVIQRILPNLENATVIIILLQAVVAGVVYYLLGKLK